MYPVSYPAFCNCLGKLGSSLGYSVKLLITLCVCAYNPLRIDARLGEHSDVVQNTFLKYTPSSPIRSMFGVFKYGCPAIPRQSHRMSSHRMNNTFGCAATR